MWNKNTGSSARPVKEQLRIEHGDRSVAVQRSLIDFGAEESFGQAAKRFGEHYGWIIDRAVVRARSIKNCDEGGFEAMNIIRKGQVQGVKKGDVRASIELVSQLFGIAQ